MKRRKKIIVFLPAVIFISNEFIRTYIRPVYGKKEYGLLSDILGWLPNYLAAFGIVSTAIVVVQVLESVGKTLAKKQKMKVLIGVSFIALLGLIGHEFGQKGSGLFYDIEDIYATIAGTLTGDLLYYLLIIKPRDSAGQVDNFLS